MAKRIDNVAHKRYYCCEEGELINEKNISMYGVSDEDFDTQVHRLGNLTLLEASINNSIHNSTYSAKCSAYTHSKFYLTRSISSLAAIGINNAITRTNQRLKAWAVWNAASIEERQYMLYELSEEIWGLHVD